MLSRYQHHTRRGNNIKGIQNTHMASSVTYGSMNTEWYRPLPVIDTAPQQMKSQGAKIENSDRDVEREIRQEIGNRIAELRRKRKLSARLVGEKLGISREAITHIETGRNNINALALWKLATLFHCDITDFFPDVPDGYGLTKIDTDKIAQEGGQKAAKWARQLFGKKP